MLPYVNMINHDANDTRRQANEAQAAAIYQGLRRTGRLVRTAAHALRRLWAAPVRALHSRPQKSAQVSGG
ncbi:hypothetical protein [Roseinatronobacter sp. S2]|uniref:hypothetical protein n=1 Tax=Roseinatronobacter sp. S2 TaxID=3035471 RepID=UPI00240F5A2E|nr:hypothetical protein [Roseinatronobacter sp. S2]WFE77039.1 hypothetical protein P8S53_20105 [Roseinatronobacter sp. S2]